MRFDPTYYTTTETNGSVTVWVHVDEGVSEHLPFTVALIPAEGDVITLIYSKSNIQYFFLQGLRSPLITIN